LLSSYVAKGAYTDCYAAGIAANVSFADYVEAFYTSGPFKCERLVLWAIGKPSSDSDARRLARGETETFAAWRVEARAPDQILLCDFMRRTRSWLMLAPTESSGARLYFGSAVVPVGIGSGKARLGFPFNALLGFHRLYSCILLSAARGRVLSQTKRAKPKLRP
jgi:hypothetical protein